MASIARGDVALSGEDNHAHARRQRALAPQVHARTVWQMDVQERKVETLLRQPLAGSGKRFDPATSAPSVSRKYSAAGAKVVCPDPQHAQTREPMVKRFLVAHWRRGNIRCPRRPNCFGCRPGCAVHIRGDQMRTTTAGFVAPGYCPTDKCRPRCVAPCRHAGRVHARSP